ncbi:sensor histidine kinase [Streptomyces sp. NPDC057702]|uniref:sensor histidine kinase n=1 Tax=unclassified Streptomyces TaxID=2593676 RepID=UPI003692DC8F
MTPRRVPAPLLDVLLVVVGLLDLWINVDLRDRTGLWCALVAAGALLLRRTLPLCVYVVTLPATLVTAATAATLVTLATLAARTRSRAVIGGCTAAFAICYALPWPPGQFTEGDYGIFTALTAGHGFASAVAAIFLGQLVQARRALSARLAEIIEARETERVLTAQTALATERAQLAREMHDVVSHQVTLIAVRSGALQVSTRDPGTREAATTIRRLSVQTLEELRHMVSVLRATGSAPTELTPQPTLAGLGRLVTGSGIETELHLELPDEVPPPVQRAVYRTVQEALTNVRKHAPGARAVVRVQHTPAALTAEVTNTVATRPALRLPSSQHGLDGLRQRAALLGGRLDAAPTGEGGYRLRLELPL